MLNKTVINTPLPREFMLCFTQSVGPYYTSFKKMYHEKLYVYDSIITNYTDLHFATLFFLSEA